MEQSGKTELKESIIEALKDIRTSLIVEDILERGAWEKDLRPSEEELSEAFNELIKEGKVAICILPPRDSVETYHVHFRLVK